MKGWAADYLGLMVAQSKADLVCEDVRNEISSERLIGQAAEQAGTWEVQDKAKGWDCGGDMRGASSPTVRLNSMPHYSDKMRLGGLLPPGNKNESLAEKQKALLVHLPFENVPDASAKPRFPFINPAFQF